MISTSWFPSDLNRVKGSKPYVFSTYTRISAHEGKDIPLLSLKASFFIKDILSVKCFKYTFGMYRPAYLKGRYLRFPAEIFFLCVKSSNIFWRFEKSSLEKLHAVENEYIFDKRRELATSLRPCKVMFPLLYVLIVFSKLWTVSSNCSFAPPKRSDGLILCPKKVKHWFPSEILSFANPYSKSWFLSSSLKENLFDIFLFCLYLRINLKKH